MPPGVPVAAGGIDSAKNAALLALRILAINNKELRENLAQYTASEAEKVRNARQTIVDLPVAPSEAFQEQ